ncbi:Lysophospholipase, alpha-beta hydrolase superfamily [Algoriphagus faecimaris]|uniref:Monoacylglycerol lipase n=1 Tax=Algoriphagus faecimaris TaxID=686796 RepID=A0A1G6NFQ5_9BACT|nr:alpha/beta hydrolase [Algoriphagus faecimaris]SDC66117.1 Lysophospholipase, alpha-beta hydrolase superfamily [Algoriphagus faecimaris]
MKHLETSYQAPDGVQLYLQAWMPGQAKAALLLVHGLGEHSGRYDSLVEGLTHLGVAVFTFDGRGHGKSDLPKPSAYVDSYSLYLEDIDALYGKVKAYVPGQPTFIFGHSMGGGMVAAYALKFRPETNGLILSAPAIKEAEGTSALLILLSGILNWISPRFKALALDILGVSRIPEEVEKYKKDPLVYQDKIPVRTGYELLQMMRYIQSNAISFDFPFLIMHGSADRLTNPKGSQLLFDASPSSDKSFRRFEGAYHELLNDLDREEVLEVILDWVKERI